MGTRRPKGGSYYSCSASLSEPHTSNILHFRALRLRHRTSIGTVKSVVQGQGLEHLHALRECASVRQSDRLGCPTPERGNGNALRISLALRSASSLSTSRDIVAEVLQVLFRDQRLHAEGETLAFELLIDLD